MRNVAEIWRMRTIIIRNMKDAADVDADDCDYNYDDDCDDCQQSALWDNGCGRPVNIRLPASHLMAWWRDSTRASHLVMGHTNGTSMAQVCMSHLVVGHIMCIMHITHYAHITRGNGAHADASSCELCDTHHLTQHTMRASILNIALYVYHTWWWGKFPKHPYPGYEHALAPQNCNFSTMVSHNTQCRIHNCIT